MKNRTVIALRIIHNHDIRRPKQFGLLFWPAHPGWQRLGRCGKNGVTKGVGMRLAAGAFLGRLQRQGFVTLVGDQYRLTERGIEILVCEY